MSLVLYLISLVAAALGRVVALWLQDQVSIDGLGSLSQTQINALITALVWFLICFVVFFAASKLREVRWFKLLSLKFFLTWAFVCAGVILGFILWILIDSGSVSVTNDQIMDQFFFSLPLSLGPTGAASIGLRD